MFEEFRNVKGPSRAIHRSIGYNLALARREKVGVSTGEHERLVGAYPNPISEFLYGYIK